MTENTDQPLDPAAIMAEHRHVTTYGLAECAACGIGGGNVGVSWPCLPYRLAEALQASERELAGERARRVEAELDSVRRTDLLNDALDQRDAERAKVERVEELYDFWYMVDIDGERIRTISVSDVRAALAGEGAAKS